MMNELNRLKELAGLITLQEAMKTRGAYDGMISSIDVGANDIKKIKELGKAADTLGFDWMLWGIGYWEAGGDTIFGTPLLILKGRSLYYEDIENSRGLIKASPQNSSAKIQFSVYKGR